MKIAYRAQNLIDAQLIKDQLTFREIDCRIQGEYLPGGMGGLPTMELIHVLVNDDDFASAREVIDEWEGDHSKHNRSATAPAVDYIPVLLFVAVLFSAIVMLLNW